MEKLMASPRPRWSFSAMLITRGKKVLSWGASADDANDPFSFGGWNHDREKGSGENHHQNMLWQHQSSGKKHFLLTFNQACSDWDSSLGFSFLSSIRSRLQLKPKRNGFDLIPYICSRMWVGETRFVRGPECRERNYDSPRLLRTNNILGVDPSWQDFISPSLNCQKSHFLQRSSNMPI